jgi:Cof subfamily protein (haloacid dehalogenase superfamily)
MKYSAIILDLDGTFLNSDKRVSERNFRAVQACIEMGMKVIFATARPPRAVNWFLPKELMNSGSFIFYNGAQVVCKLTGFELHEPIESALTARVIEHCIGYAGCELTMEVKDEWFSLSELDFSTSMNVRANPVVKTIEELEQYHATKILITGMGDVESSLYQKFRNELNILQTDGGKLIQIMSKKASKELAVKKLCSNFDISLNDVIVFGDDFNDYGLFKVCGYSVAMGNAIKEIKEIANEVTETNDNDGVAEVLERILE